MKSKQRGSTDAIGILAYLILMVIVVAISWFFKSWSCSSKWEYSGMQTSWGPVKGCLVQTPNGYWIPAERIREVDLTPRTDEKPTQGAK